MKHTRTWLGLILLLLTSQLYAQRPSAEAIYRGIEFREVAPDQESWIITDSRVVRAVMTRLIAGNAIVDTAGRAVSGELRRDIGRLMSANQVTISCARRRYDDHLDRMVILVPGNPSLGGQIAPLEDWVYMSDLLGSDLYSLVQSRQYAWSGTTGDDFDARQQFTYDLYLSALNPHAMLWQTTRAVPTKSDLQRNVVLERWMVSVWGRLGSDNLDLPFWFKGTGCAGIRVDYVDDALVPDRDYERYSIQIGFEEPINFSVRSTGEPSAGSPFKQRRLQGSGTAVVIGGTWTPKWEWSRHGQHLTMNLESSLAISERQTYGTGIPDEFYTVRNYLSMSARLHHMGLFRFAAGFTWHDLQQRTTSALGTGGLHKISDNYIPFVELGIADDGGLLQYSVDAQVNYTMGGGYGFLVVSSHIMVSNTVGIDFRYFKSLQSANLPSWQYDNYIAVSPIIRINY